VHVEGHFSNLKVTGAVHVKDPENGEPKSRRFRELDSKSSVRKASIRRAGHCGSKGRKSANDIPQPFEAGECTDDTSMALCLAESLVEYGVFNRRPARPLRPLVARGASLLE
jgi:hypothetical protein